MPLDAGLSLGRYEIRSLLGAGGMAEVYLASDTRLERNVALKILPDTLAEEDQRMNRFVREAKAASALNHPNIITIYEIGEHDNTQFIATEYIAGVTLRTLASVEPLDVEMALEIAVQVATVESDRASSLLRELGYAYAATGKRSEALAIVKELEENYTRREAIGQDLAAVYAGLGERDKAFAWLEKDFQARSGQLAGISWYSPFETLRDDPRYADLMRRMNLSQ